MSCELCDKEKCNCYDKIILEKRSQKYQRNNSIMKMVEKHSTGKCDCKKNNKICNYDLPFLKDVKSSYLESKEEGDKFVMKNIEFFETLYNTSQSITQSLKSKAGRDWEDSFEETLQIAKIIKNKHFASQVNIDNEGNFLEKKKKGKNTGHKLDFVIPPPKLGTNIKDHKGFIISNKTTCRERVHQDKFIGKFVLITTDKYDTKDENIRTVSINQDDDKLTRFIYDIKKLLDEIS
jgi:hypothetical protein